MSGIIKKFNSYPKSLQSITGHFVLIKRWHQRWLTQCVLWGSDSSHLSSIIQNPVWRGVRWKGKCQHMLCEWCGSFTLIKKESHYIFVCALDFIRPPRLSVIAVGHFVRLNIFRAPDALGSLGYHSCDPHPSLEVNLKGETWKRQEIDEHV